VKSDQVTRCVSKDEVCKEGSMDVDVLYCAMYQPWPMVLVVKPEGPPNPCPVMAMKEPKYKRRRMSVMYILEDIQRSSFN
jgi:hypothetical protein